MCFTNKSGFKWIKNSWDLDYTDSLDQVLRDLQIWIPPWLTESPWNHPRLSPEETLCYSKCTVANETWARTASICVDYMSGSPGGSQRMRVRQVGGCTFTDCGEETGLELWRHWAMGAFCLSDRGGMKGIDTQTHKRSNRLCESGGGWLSVMFSLMVEGEGDKRRCHWAGGLLHKTIPGSGRLVFIWKEWVKIGENYSFWNRDGFMGWPRHRPTPLLGLYLWVNKYLCCISFFYN